MANPPSAELSEPMSGHCPDAALRPFPRRSWTGYAATRSRLHLIMIAVRHAMIISLAWA